LIGAQVIAPKNNRRRFSSTGNALGKLTDDELDELERLFTKAAVTDEGQQPIPSDEYLPSDEPSA
jgi:hypothetical protein